MKILVIGSNNHNRAECFDWLQPFPNLEEYDSIIINLQSLTQEMYDKIWLKIRRMKELISTVFETEREIFCIIGSLIYPPQKGKKGLKASYPVSPWNYDWLPVGIEIRKRLKGTSINVSNHRFDKYFRYVDRWGFEIELNPKNLIRLLFYEMIPIAENKSKKMIEPRRDVPGLCRPEDTFSGAFVLLSLKLLILYIIFFKI